MADVTDRADGIGVPGLILLIRGRAELDVVDGIPDEYLEASGTYEMTPEQRVDWEAEVRSLYDGMVRIVVTPTWAKLIDFETTLPSAVEELARQRDERLSAARSPALGGSPTPQPHRGARTRPTPAGRTGCRSRSGDPTRLVWLTTVPFAPRTRSGSLCPSVAPRSARSL